MLLDEESEEYNLYSEDERKEFVFQIFQMLVLGGTLCQFEDTLQPYLDVTQNIYKDLVRLLSLAKKKKTLKKFNYDKFNVKIFCSVQKQHYSNDLFVNTLVLQVIAKDGKNQDYYPSNSNNRQNIAFLLVNGESREITTFLHQYGGYCVSE